MSVSSWSSGSIHIFANPKVNGTRTVIYLGTGERAPQSSHENLRVGVANDLKGGDYDRMHTGKRAQTAWTVTRTDHARMESLMSVPGGDPGGDTIETLGTLLGTEDEFFVVWFLKARRNVAAMVAQGMPSGRRYPYTELASFQIVEGMQPNSYAVSFLHHEFHEPSDITVWTLWDEDMAEVSGLALT